MCTLFRLQAASGKQFRIGDQVVTVKIIAARLLIACQRRLSASKAKIDRLCMPMPRTND